jgi:hypothetical protein
MKRCVTINILLNATVGICQISNKEGTCLEKDEITARNGYRMCRYDFRNYQTGIFVNVPLTKMQCSVMYPTNCM